MRYTRGAERFASFALATAPIGRRHQMSSIRPYLTILAGPNGVGKSTLARELLGGLLSDTRFVNADDIARELSGSNLGRLLIAAARTALRRRRNLLDAREDFALETLAGVAQPKSTGG